MRKVAILFVLAVLAPSVVLALLASRTLSDQQFVLERQQTLLYQTVTDSFAKEINDFLAEQQRQFNELVEHLVTNAEPRATAAQFDDQLRAAWPLAEVGFAVTLNGALLCPSPAARPETRLFCLDNGGFLANKESVEVYWNDSSTKNNYLQNVQKNTFQQQRAEIQQLANFDPTNALSALNFTNLKSQSRKVNPAQQVAQTFALNEAGPEQNVSKVFATEAEFRQLIGEATDGMLARFLQNKLRLMFWHRLERDPQLVFGAQLNLAQVKTLLRSLVEAKQEVVIKGYDSYFNRRNSIAETTGAQPSVSRFPDEVCVVILDENTTPVASSNPSGQSHSVVDRRDGVAHIVPAQAATNLKRPFVSTEIGEALPHWEVAAYLMNPDAIKKAALTARLTLGLLIALLLIAMVVGSFLIVNDLNRQVTLARQKTDFVSNVSHELKTPLTSIRMFAELLAEDRVAERDKQKSYLNIITSEAARLTRLINNVLDFSRLERGEKKYNLGELNLAALVNETVATYRPHLESNGFRLEYNPPETPVAVRGDRDALAQIIVNLISNAEKYSNGSKEVVVEIASPTETTGHAEVRVLDRGPGVPRGLEEKIFEQFYRVPDSLSSGIQGSGLGLTLARQIARAHGGDVIYSAREGGGSCFALRLPLSPSDGVAAGRVRG